jgi:transcriptional regulator with XRE-family HTH domain
MKPTKSPLEVFKPAKSTAELVKAFRANFDISQTEMAAACGISQPALSAIENGQEIGPVNALRLAAFMGLSPELVLYPGGYENHPEYQEVKRRIEILGPTER